MTKINDNLVIKKERRIKIGLSIRTVFLFLIYAILLFTIWYLIYFKYIQIYLTEPSSKNEGYFFTILNSLMMLMFLVACGFAFEMSKKKFKIVIFMFIIFLLIEGFTNIGLGIRFRENFDLLIKDTYESNTSDGIEFFIYNFFSFWIYIFIISLFFEAEKD